MYRHKQRKLAQRVVAAACLQWLCLAFAPGADTCSPYEWLDDKPCVAGKNHSKLNLYKMVVDLHTTRPDGEPRIFSGGPCPGLHEADGTKMFGCAQAGVPLIWTLSRDAFGSMLLRVASTVPHLSLYSLSTLDRRVGHPRRHLQIRENSSCATQQNATTRTNAMARKVLTHLKCQLRIKTLGPAAGCRLWYRSASQDRTSSNDIYLLTAKPHSYEYTPCQGIKGESGSNGKHSYSCLPHTTSHAGKQSYSVTFDVAVTALNVFVLACVFFVAPLPPLRLTSALLERLSSVIAERYRPVQRSNTAAETAAVAADDLRNDKVLRRPVSYHHQECSQPGCQFFSSYRLVPAMPDCLLSSQVWPSLGLLLSPNAKNLVLLLLYLFAYIVWPLVYHLVILHRFVDPADASQYICQWLDFSYTDTKSIPQDLFILALAPFLLLAPPVFVLARLCDERRRPLRSAVFSSDKQAARRRKEVRIVTACKLADGTLKLHPWSDMSIHLHRLVVSIVRRLVLSVPRFLTRACAAMPELCCPLSLSLSSSKAAAAAKLAILLAAMPPLLVGSLLWTAACVAADLLRCAYGMALLALQSVPLLRLSTLATFGAVWSVFDLEGSLIAPLASAFISFPIMVSFNAIFQYVFLYTFFTCMGLVTNYSSELVICASIVSTVLLRLRRQCNNFYEPFLSLQAAIVDHCKSARLDYLVSKSRGLMSSPSSCRQPESDSTAPRASSSLHTQDSEMLRFVAAETFLALSYKRAVTNYPEIDSVLEDLPWAWCGTVAGALRNACTKLHNIGTRSKKPAQVLKDTPSARLVRIGNPRCHGGAFAVRTKLQRAAAGHSGDAAMEYHSAAVLLDGTGLHDRLESARPPPENLQLTPCSSSSLADILLATPGAASMCRQSSRCSNWKEMEEVMKSHIREKTVSSIAYAALQAVLALCVLFFALEFGLLLESGQTIIKLLVLAIPLADYAWHHRALGTSYELKGEVVEKFNDLLRQELQGQTEEEYAAPAADRSSR